MTPRDGSSNTRLYVGRVADAVRERDLEDLFAKYGRVRSVDMKVEMMFWQFRGAFFLKLIQARICLRRI